MKSEQGQEKELIETLSAIEHKRWAHWQRYCHAVCIKNNDGSLTIPSCYVKWWKKQIKTAYEDLSKKAKQMDRDEVMKYIHIVKSYYRRQAIAEFLGAINTKTRSHREESRGYVDYRDMFDIRKIAERLIKGKR